MSIREPNIDRLLAAFQLLKHDRVPHLEYVDPKSVNAILGKQADRRNDQLPPDDAVEFARRTYQDQILAMNQFWPAEEIGSITGWSDMHRIKWVDSEFRLSSEKIDAMHRHTRDRFKAVEGTNIGVGLCIAGPMFSVYESLGPIPIQSFMLLIHDDIEFVKRIMDIQVDVQIAILEELRSYPFAFIEIADDLCDNNGFMVHPNFMMEVWHPRAAKTVKAAKSYDIPVSWHCCGKLDSVLPILVDWLIDGISPIQTSCNDIYAIKKEWGDRISLLGNMNIEGVLYNGTTADVVADTKEHIDRLSYNGGYVVQSSHSIVDAIPTENYLAMIDTVLEEGQF
jgi:uroporphyrinogen decarboxylase